MYVVSGGVGACRTAWVSSDAIRPCTSAAQHLDFVATTVVYLPFVSGSGVRSRTSPDQPLKAILIVSGDFWKGRSCISGETALSAMRHPGQKMNQIRSRNMRDKHV